MEALCRTLEEPSKRVSPMVQAIWSRVVRQYAAFNPSILAVVGEVLPSACGDQDHQAAGQSPLPIYHDHFAFRTFGVAGLGIASLAGPLQQLGYVQQVGSTGSQGPAGRTDAAAHTIPSRPMVSYYQSFKGFKSRLLCVSLGGPILWVKVLSPPPPKKASLQHSAVCFSHGPPGSTPPAPSHYFISPEQGDLFEFPGKKLTATWFAPEDKTLYDLGLPRIFVSEIQVRDV